MNSATKADLQIARLVGGAGTGKTTALLQIMEQALAAIGHDPLLLGFASFTRAARAEAVERASKAWNVSPDLLSNRGWFRTVHSIAYRCLQITGGQVIGGSKRDSEWVSNAIGVKVSTILDEDTGSNKFIGDPTAAAALNCWELARTTLTPLHEVVRRKRIVDSNVPDFARIVRVSERYEDSKLVDNRCDFTDMLMRFSGTGMTPSGDAYLKAPEGMLPEVVAWLFDEQQDASPLMDRACRRLVSAPSVRWCYVVGDPFQAIYGFAGSSADCFLAWDANKQKTMPKSYRCPAPILELGERCLRRMHKGYFDRGIAPADHDGSVTEVGSIQDAVSSVDPRNSWLLIARTNYEASRIAAEMTSAHKPWRSTKSPDGINNRGVGLTALWSLQHGEGVKGWQWAKALELLPARDESGPLLTRGTKTKWKDSEMADRWDVIFPGDLGEIGCTETLLDAIKSGGWIRYVDDGKAWHQQATRWGAELASNPTVRIGTIHSVKGAEADNVAVLTTFGKNVEAGMEDPGQHDEEQRIAYVAVTRARHNLTVINETGRNKRGMEIL
jgi:superfamily I DNA/RNA helicase